MAEAESQNQLPELLAALQKLDKSTIRDARIARIYLKMQRIDEAKNLLAYHRDCPLCVAWYAAIVSYQGGEPQMKSLLKQFTADSFEVGADTTDIEAKARLHIARGGAYVNLKNRDQARMELEKAIMYCDALGDDATRLTALSEMARCDFLLGHQQEALDTYCNIVTVSPPGMLVDFGFDSIVGLSWLTNRTPECLKDAPWAAYTLDVMRLKRPAGQQPAPPQGVETPDAALALEKLHELIFEVNLNGPSYYSERNSERKRKLIALIHAMYHKKTNVDEVSKFILRSAQAISLCIQQDPKGLTLAEESLSAELNQIPMVVMAHFATIIQAYAYFPNVTTSSLNNALRTFKGQYHNLQEAERNWLLWWVEKFCPVALFLLTEMDERLSHYRSRFLWVFPRQAVLNGQKVSGYPYEFVCENLEGILSSSLHPASPKHRVQNKRHKDFLSGKQIYVVYDRIVSRML
ncbi:hypothetical protein [Deinococcus roseus]|nr:hypothetical protein [Deinococcus roseus]